MKLHALVAGLLLTSPAFANAQVSGYVQTSGSDKFVPTTDSHIPLWNHELIDENDKVVVDHCDVPAQPAVPATATDPAKAATPPTDCHNLTLGILIRRILNNDKLRGEDGWAMGALGYRIKHDPDTKLDEDEKVTVKKLVLETYPPFYINQIMSILFPNDPTPKLKAK